MNETGLLVLWSYYIKFRNLDLGGTYFVGNYLRRDSFRMCSKMEIFMKAMLWGVASLGKCGKTNGQEAKKSATISEERHQAKICGEPRAQCTPHPELVLTREGSWNVYIPLPKSQWSRAFLGLMTQPKLFPASAQVLVAEAKSPWGTGVLYIKL